NAVAVDDPDVDPDAGVLIDDGVVDDRAVADAQAGQATALVVGPLGRRVIQIGPDQDAIVQGDVASNLGANTDDAAGDRGARADDTAVGHQALIQAGGVYAAGGQVAHAGVNDAFGGVEVERRMVAAQSEVGLVVRLDGADVLPVAVEQIR